MFYRKQIYRLVRTQLGKDISITVSRNTQGAEINGIGSVIGKVRSVEYGDQDDQQHVRILLKDESGDLRIEADWVLPPPQNPSGQATSSVSCKGLGNVSLSGPAMTAYFLLS